MTKPTYDDHVGNGSNKNFGYTYPILKTEDVKVSVDGVTQTSGYTVNESNTRVEFTTAPADTAKVRVYRETTVGKTNGDEDPKAIFAAGSSIKASELNANQEQALFGIQELQDKEIQTEDLADDAITSAKILDGTITNANLNASAAIAGSKVAPTFGAQNISTSGTLAAGATTVTGNIAVSGTVDGRDVAADGTKLDGVATSANNYTHPTDAGNKHIPAGGSSGQFLKYSSSGTAVWAADNDTTYSVGDGGLTQNNFTNTLKTKLDGIAAGATAQVSDGDKGDITVSNSGTTFTIDNDAITNAKIADDAIDSAQLGTGVIDEEHLSSGAITNAKLGSGAVTASKIAAYTIAVGNMANNAVSPSILQTDAVTEVKIQDQAVTLGKLAADLRQSSISDSDTQIPTSGAVVDYVTAQIAPIGGLEVIATDAAFPNTQPASGVVISIADAGGLVVDGSGSSTTGRTVGGSTVTINNINSQFNSSTITNGVAMMVSSTGSSQTYNYHKATLREQDITSISTDIEDFGNRYRVGSSNPTSNNDDGDLFFNTTSNKMLVYNATGSSWDEVQSVGNFYINTISSYSGTGGNNATFNGSAYRFVLSNAPTYAQQLLVSINGVIQKPNAGTSQPSEGFSIDGSSIIFSSAPPSGADYFIVTIGAAVNIGAPSDNTVTAAKIGAGAVETAKIANGAVTNTQIADDTIAEVKLDIHNAPSGTDKFLKYTANGMEWAVDNNTVYTHPNHSGEVTSTADGATVITDDVVDEANLKISNAGSNGQFLSKQSGNTGGLTWASVTSTPEGTAILSTGESGGAKYLREDGDGSCSWQSVSQYSTPLTTQGDILYRDGSGDQRLAKGTAGQVLKMNSGATAPEWGTAGVSISNDANNRVTTADGSAGLVGEANLTFDGSTLAVTGNQTTTLATQSQGYESPATVAANWSIGANNNAMFPGPMTVASGVTVTVPANRTLTVV